MPDLKTTLFEHAKDYYEKWKEFQRRLGKNHVMTIKCQNKYYGCHLVLIRSGLEPEYEIWLKEQKEGSEKNVSGKCCSNTN